MDKKNFKKTKIVATIGPATETKDIIKELIKKGVNVFRLNTSHGNIEDHSQKFDTIREAMKETNTYCAIMIDLQGPKIRVGNFEGEIELKCDENVTFIHGKGDIPNKIIPVDYQGIANDVKEGNKILLDDGKIQAEVVEVKDNQVITKITNGGFLKQRKGLNIPGCTNSLKTISERDLEFLKFAVEKKADYIALSFVRNKEDVLLAKKYINDLNSDIPVISKLEKPQALENLKEIVSVSDSIMVARGDLGIELSPVEVPVAQKKIIQECTKQKKPVIVATQMLESMINQPIPTRAESSDVANAILDGADAVMLSAETSTGQFPLKAVETMAEIALQVENSNFYKYDLDFNMSENLSLTRQAVTYGAIAMLDVTDAKAIISFSKYGSATKLLSKLKPKAPVILITDDEQTAQRMALYWGVKSYVKNWDNIADRHILSSISNFLIDELELKNGDSVIVEGSIPKLISGKADFVRIHKVET